MANTKLSIAGTSGRHLFRRLRTLRVEKGLSQREISEKINISRTYFSQLENELKEPTLSVFLRYCDILDVSVAIFDNKITIKKVLDQIHK